MPAKASSGQNAADLVSLPQGGGALSGIGETFRADPHTGTATMSVPLRVPPGRLGLTPSLSLAYSSGNPNGPFGLGWALSIPGVRRKTADGVPRYDGTDVFVLAGVEDLMPVPSQPDDPAGSTRYRPRVETSYVRILHITGATGDYWEIHATDGQRTRYGTPRVAQDGWRDPATITTPDGSIFGWLISETADPLGNRVVYDYVPDPHGTAERYLSRIRYVDYGDPAAGTFLAGVDFAYADRPDPYSDRRGGFDLRSTQRAVSMTGWTAPDGGTATPSIRTDLGYADQNGAPAAPGASLLTSITVTGIDGAATQRLPPLTFGYQAWDPSRRSLRQVSGALPTSPLGGALDLVDLFGDGLPSLVLLDGVTARYWRNTGNASFSLPRSLAAAPAGVDLGTAGVYFADVNGDGRPELVAGDARRTLAWSLAVPGGDQAGFDPAGLAWTPSAAVLPLSDPLTRLVDLDGDGRMDLLRTDTTWYAADGDGRGGFATLRSLPGAPPVTIDDPRVHLADMTGDGLSDVVLVTNGGVEYWPALGRGRYDAPVMMSGSPRYDDARLYPGIGYDTARLLLADLTGDGTSDIVYVGDGSVTIWLNQSGNGFAAPVRITGTPAVNSHVTIRTSDLLGSGTAGILWTADASQPGPYRFLDLTGGVKPYLLSTIDNHAGATTAITYATSTSYAIADRDAGRPWRTTLPMPVHVVAVATTSDYFSAITVTSEYSYHHGYWDGVDREFRGFVRVDQRDNRMGEPTRTPPVEVRTWFHPGPVGSSRTAWREIDFTDEYWSGDPILQPGTSERNLPADLPQSLRREAVRALRGSTMRTETYARDGTDVADRPYTVVDGVYESGLVLDGRVATDPGWVDAPVTTAFQVLSRTSAWQRGSEPKTTVTASGVRDAYGRVRSRLTIGVPRGRDPRSATSGDAYLGQVSITEYATRDDGPGYFVDKVALDRREEIADPGGTTLLDLIATTLATADSGGSVGAVRAWALTFYDGDPYTGLPYGQIGTWGLPVRSQQLALTADILAGVSVPGDGTALPATPPVYLPPGGTPTVGTWPVEYPAGFIAGLAPLAGYTYEAATGPYVAGYYVEGTRTAYDIQTGAGSCGLPVVHRDALGADTTVTYDAYALLIASITDPAGLTTTAVNDYRLLRAAAITDPNGVTRQVGSSPLGLPSWTATVAPAGVEAGDTAAQPLAVFDYALTAWDDSAGLTARQPTSVRTTHRVDHRWTLVAQAQAARTAAGQAPLTDAEIGAMFPAGEVDLYPDRFTVVTAYSDGLGRPLQSRAQADAATIADLGLDADQTAPARAVTVAADPDRVIVTGAKRYDDKGRVVQAWEPYFSSGTGWQPPTSDQVSGLASATTTYDAIGLAVQVTAADGSVALLVPGVPTDLNDPSAYRPTPWETYHYDADDNAGRTDPAGSSSWSVLWNTPTSGIIDALGRQVVSTSHLPGGGTSDTRTAYDIDGRITSVTDPLGRIAATNGYDLLGRVWRAQTIDGGVQRSVYDPLGGIVEARDDRGTGSLAAYDAMHRPTRHWAIRQAGVAASLCGLSVYGDDPSSGLSAAQASAVYALGRIVRTYDEAGLAVVDAYDIDANVIGKSRRVLRTDVMVDALPGGSGLIAATDWATAAYRVDWQPAAGGTLAEQEAALLDPTVYASAGAFDALGRMVSLTGPVQADGARTTLAYGYSRGGGLTSLSAGGTAHLSRIVYNARGQRSLAVLGNGTMIRYVYDAATFRLARMRAEPAGTVTASSWSGTSVASAVLQDYGYAYDLVGNLLTLRDRTPGSGLPIGPGATAGTDALDRGFTYDPLYRLISATGRETATPPAQPWVDTPASVDVTIARPYTEAYTYDLVGNMLGLAHQASAGYTRTFAPESSTNRLTSMSIGADTYAYAYDAAGNMLSEAGVRGYEWDHAGRCTGFRIQTGTATPSVYAQYRYDPTGTRVLKLVRRGARTDVTIYVDGIFERLIIGADSPATSTTHDDVHLVDGVSRIAILRFGAPVPGDPFPGIVYHLGDHLASSVAVVAAGGALLNREEYTPYGETSFGSYATKRYRFTAKERDQESGLAYHGARYYAPWLGRWTAADPVFPAGNLSWYRYGNCAPTQVADPSGAEDAPAIKWYQPLPPTADPGEDPPVVLPHDIQQMANGPLGQAYRENVMDSHFAAAVGNASEALGAALGDSPQTPTGRPLALSERLSVAGRVDSLALGYTLGLGFNTTHCLVGPDGESCGRVSDEMFQNTLAIASVALHVLPAVRQGLNEASAVESASEVGSGRARRAPEGHVYRGGARGDLGDAETRRNIPGTERNHMPADSVTPTAYDRGPAIEMDEIDHRQTASCGSGTAAVAHRAEQAALIKKGRYMEALQMDIDDIHAKFGCKYDEAIAEMLDYIHKSDIIREVNAQLRRRK